MTLHAKAADNLAETRKDMVEHYIASRGVRSPLLLDVMAAVPREAFLPPRLRSHAYQDTPLPIGKGQTISQPYIVAIMIEALGLSGGEKVLEIGAGSGYAAAVLSGIAGEVYAIERIGELAASASETLAELGYRNVHVRHADGTLGWPEHAPYDGILVSAGAPEVPNSLKSQLKVGGRMVIPVGADPKIQELICITRKSEDEYTTEDIADVSFVPLLGEEAWRASDSPQTPAWRLRTSRDRSDLGRGLVAAIGTHSEPFGSLDEVDLEGLLKRIGNARVVLIGEATHGTSEFYRLRERISRALIVEKAFNFVAIEGDWPDAARIDHYVRHSEFAASEWTAFARFPSWMWRNEEVREFVDWLRAHNGAKPPALRAAFHGLDLYSLQNSIRSILDYLDVIDPAAAAIARERYGCLTPWQADPATYGRAALTDSFRTCESEVVQMLTEILAHAREYAQRNGERYLDVVQNARLVANAERYYRIMYYGSRAAWNLRDTHMFETLTTLFDFYGPDSRAIVWAHNSHVGNAAATEMSARGEHNLGQLCRNAFGSRAYLIGFGTDSGTVAAASDWDGPMHVMPVKHSLPRSYERLCHAATEENGTPNFMLPLRSIVSPALREDLEVPRLERAIGVIYRPETELASHYFQASLPRQFDDYIWLDRTQAVRPLATHDIKGMPDTYPFGQ